MTDALIVKKLDELIEKVDSIESAQKKMIDIMKHFEEKHSALVKKVDELTARLNTIEQKELINDFKILGAPLLPNCTKDESFGVIKKFFKIAGTDVKKEDLIFWTYLANRDKGSGQFLGRFANNNTKMKAFKSFKLRISTLPILWQDIVTDLPENDLKRARRLGLRSRLTPATFSLLRKAKEHSEKFQYIWESQGRIFIRKAEGLRAHEIKSEAQLTDLVAKLTAEHNMEV